MSSTVLNVLCCITLFAVVSAQIGFEVHVYNSLGVRISDGNPTYRELYQGDFVYCLAPEANDDTHVYFAWVKLGPEPGEEPAPGPNFLSFPNEADHTNRMYIGKTLGNGEDVTYSCIATDIDPYQFRDEFVGAQFRFRVVQPPDAGYIFEEKDYVALPGQTIDLACERHSPFATVVWDTLDSNGEVITSLYNTESPGTLPTGYVFVNQEENADDFMLRITMSEETAIFTRCTITYNSLTDVSHTAMLFQIDFDNGGCEADGLDTVDGNSAGQVIRFQGCDVVTSFSSDAELDKNDYTTMTYWQESTEEDPTVFFPLDNTRTLDEDSRHTIQATPYTHGHSYSCTVEVHREEAAIIRAKIENICPQPFVVSVIENTVRFRVYYGGESADDFIRFDTQGNAAIAPSTHWLMCFLDRMPLQDGDDVITMQYRAPGEDWVDSDSHIIRDMDIHVGHNYRCVFRDTDEPDNNAESGIIHMVNGFVTTSIFDSDGNPLDSVDIHDINSGDYIECRSDDPIDPVYPPSFFWYRSNQIANPAGPKTIRLSNTDDETNRLPVSANLGLGDPISYRCIGADLLEAYIIPDFAGTLIQFQAILPTGGSAGTSFVQADFAAEEGATVTYECTRATNNGILVWETVNAATNERVQLIYDTVEDNELPAGYERTGTGNDYTLEITVSQETAILTRCTVTEDAMSDATSTAMIYLISPLDNGGCRADAGAEIEVGEMVELSGCDAEIVVNADSGVANDDYQAIFFWEQKLSGADDYMVLEESRALEEESVFHIEALSPAHDSACRCGLQISRPNEYAISANVMSLCEDDLILDIKANDVRFRIYYGQPDNAGGDNYIHFPASAIDVGKTDDGSLTCEYDRHPEAANQDSHFMQSRVGATGDWTDHDDVINPNEVVTGSHYRCVFRDADGEDSESNIIRIVDGENDLTAVSIFLNGELLDEEAVNEVSFGDILSCSPSGDSVVVPTYVWYKSNDYDAIGPNMIQTDNAEDGSNRLYVHFGLGEGMPIAYRCIAGGDLGVGFPEIMGTKVRFTVIEDDTQGDGSVQLTAGITTVLVMIATLVNHYL